MAFWKKDLRPGLDNNVSSSPNDPAFWQHMVTFGVSIGLQGKLSPTPQMLANIAAGRENWPDPGADGSAETPARIDDLWHATVNSRGQFVVANNSEAFANAMRNALTTINQRRGSVSNLTANSTQLTSGTRVYQASYVPGAWTGSLVSYPVTLAGVSATPSWQASIPASATNRKVLTWAGASGTFSGATFPTPDQLAALNQSTRPLSSVSAADNVSYLKGDRSKEQRGGGTLRNRGESSVLGDIIDSSPVYVADGVNQTIFVGANDGMLHAFDATTGAELFAYVPSGIDFAKLATLSDPAYTHEYFVDGPIAVSRYATTPGQNILVGTLGRGGKGVFALDVTTPGGVTDKHVLW
jgi:type IV pilus assembly protein PilY1